jgi:hypothetical protein
MISIAEQKVGSAHLWYLCIIVYATRDSGSVCEKFCLLFSLLKTKNINK